MAELEEATRRLDHEGSVSRPEWTDLRDGARPPQVQSSEPGSTTHLPLPSTNAWRASCLLSRLLRTRLIYAPTQDQAPVPSCLVVRPVASSRRNRRRSGCGPWRDCAFRSMSQMPSVNAVRLWTIWAVTEGRAPIQFVWWRAMAPERTLAGVCREAGALVRLNVKLSDMNVAVPADDDRAIGSFSDAAWGSVGNRHHKAQRHFRQRVTTAKLRAHRRSGPGQSQGGQGGQVCGAGGWKPVLLGRNCAGDWRTMEWRSCRVHRHDCCSQSCGCQSTGRGWIRMLSVSCARAFANSLVAPGQDVWIGTDGATLDLADLLGEA